MQAFEEKIFDYVFKDVMLSQIYFKRWNSFNDICTLCVANRIGVPDDLMLYVSHTNGIVDCEAARIDISFASMLSLDASISSMHANYMFGHLYSTYWLDNFSNASLIKNLVGSIILKLVNKCFVECKANVIELWQHRFAAKKPLFRCTLIEELLIEAELHSKDNDT